MPRVVVLGTGTDVGKTHATTALVRGLATSLPTLAAKPVETGTLPAWPPHATHHRPSPRSDAGRLEAVSSLPLRVPHPLYAFADPISPHRAAREASVRIDPQAIVAWVQQIEDHATAVAHRSPLLFIETAGGAFSPLAPGLTNAHLASLLQPALVLLVAPDSLGVLHDVTAATLALATLPVPTPWVLLTGARAPDASTGTHTAELARLGGPPVLATIPRGATAFPSSVLTHFLSLVDPPST